MRRFGVKATLLAICLYSGIAFAQEALQAKDVPSSEPHFDDTFAGPIIELTADKLTVSRSILGKPAEKRTFLIKPDTRIEGRLRVRARVTVGFTKTDEGDIAKLIVVRPSTPKK